MTTENPTPEEALAAARAEVAKATEAAVTAQTGSALVRGHDDAVQTKKQLGSAYSLVATSRKAALEKVESAKAIIEAKKQELDAMQRALAAELEPLQKQLARLADGISAVNLYLGRDEQLEEIRAGESAPEGTPLTIRQSVLAMDEETALFTGDDRPFDYEDIDSFTEWLLASPDNVQQVIPDLKGVVAIMARRTPLDYTGNPIADRDKNAANLHTRWLLRNGERLYLMDTDFSVGEYLIPTRRSFTKLFENKEGEALEPGSREWLAAEEKADAITRHYMKVALILQGLVDRTAVFHPLPEGGLNLIANDAYDSGQVVLIEEDEKAIGTGRQPFAKWLEERVELLEVGQRVVGYFPRSNGSHDYERTFVTPKWASSPSTDEVHTINRTDGSYFYFSYERTDTVDDYDNWGNYLGQRAPKTKASYRIEKGGWSQKSFVPIDVVEIDEMQEYLDARTERKAYATMFPALKAAIAFKLAEEKAEAPFRALLAGQLGIEDEEARQLVKWWKTSNKWHRALNGDPVHEARAAKMIVAEHGRRNRDVPLAGLAALHAVKGAMILASRTDDLIAIVPEPRAYSEHSVPQDLFVQIHTFSRTGKPRPVQRWKTLTKAQVAKWTILGESEAWATWQLNVQANWHLPDPEIDRLLDELKEWATSLGHGPLALVKYHETGRYGAKALVYYGSRLADDDDLEQPYLEKTITIKQGTGSFARESGYRNNPGYVSTHDWRMERSRARDDEGHWNTGPEIPTPPYLTNWSGAYPDAVVWTDPAVIAADAELAALWGDRQLAADRTLEAVRNVAYAVYEGWEALDRETRRARFLEDFGDPELWEDHSKSQKKTPFPLPHNAGSPELHVLGRAVVAEGVEVAGKTVAEVLAELSAKIEGLPDALMPVRFPTAAEE